MNNNYIEKEISYKLSFFAYIGYILLVFTILFLANNVLYKKFDHYNFIFIIFSTLISIIFINTGNKRRYVIFYNDKFIIKNSKKITEFRYDELEEIKIIKEQRKNNETLSIKSEGDKIFLISSTYIGKETLYEIYNFLNNKASNADFEIIEDIGLR